MIVAKIQVNGAIAKIVHRKVIPAGIIGAQVEFDYDEDIWHELHKTVVFKGAVTKDVVTDANIVTIPHEVVEKPFFRLSIGVYGVDADGNIVIPTLWENIGAILDAAAPSGDTNTDPSLPVWAQIQAMIGNLDELETTARDNLVAAVKEAAQSGGGGGSSIALDTTLTQSGKAADAKAVGDALTGKQDKITSTNKLAYSLISGPPTIPTVPTNVSAFTNDAGYITPDQLSDVVSVADIVDNLTTNVSNKPLSAAQGVALKTMLDAALGAYITDIDALVGGDG